MRYRRAVEKVRILADACEDLSKRFPGEEPRVTSSPGVQREQAAGELEAALSGLRTVRASYWDHDWRREHRGGGSIAATAAIRSTNSGRPSRLTWTYWMLADSERVVSGVR